MDATAAQLLRAREVLAALRSAISEGRRIEAPGLHQEPSLSEFGGMLGDLCYLFEGEDDVLHLAVWRNNGAAEIDEARAVAGVLLPEVPPGLMWLKAGARSQHLYLAHDLIGGEAGFPANSFPTP